MYARIMMASVMPEKLDAAIHLWKESVAPTIRQQKGFINARLFVDRKAGKIRTVGLWESEEDYHASVTWYQSQLHKFTALFNAPPIVEGCEFVAEA